MRYSLCVRDLDVALLAHPDRELVPLQRQRDRLGRAAGAHSPPAFSEETEISI